MKRSVLIFPLICLFSFCGEPDTDAYTVETVDGVRHVHNDAPLWGDQPKVKLEFVQKIGELESDDENYIFFKPMDCGIDSEGNIYVLDFGNCRLQVFDSGGKYLHTIGRKGQGPGEFTRAFRLHIDESDLLYVYQDGSHVDIVLNREGKELYRINHNRSSTGRWCIPGNEIVTRSEYLRTNVLDPSESINNRKNILSIVDRQYNTIREFCRIFPFDNAFNEKRMNSVKITMDTDKNIYTAFRYQNRIEKFTYQGRLLWKADRKLNYKMTSPKKPDIQQFAPGVIAVKDIDANIFSTGIQVDDFGRCWVRSVLEQSSGSGIEGDYVPAKIVFEIYSNEGILLCRLAAPEVKDFFTYRIFGKRLFIVDLSKNMAVYEYRIVDLD